MKLKTIIETEIEQTIEPHVEKEIANKDLPGVDISAQDGPFITFKVTDPTSLAKLGVGTKWRTREGYRSCQANNYIKRYGHMFVVFRNRRPVIQYTPDYREVVDIFNNHVYDGQLDLIPKPQLDANSSETLMRYAENVIGGRWREAEPYILQNPEAAIYYAICVMNSRWPEAEPVIMKNPEWAYEYAINRIHGRWPEAEPYILQSPEYSYRYVRNVLKRRWAKAEPIILKSGYANKYRSFLKNLK